MKVRSTLYVGSVSADRVAWSLERPTHPSAGHWAPRTSAAGGRLQETLCGAAGCSWDSRRCNRTAWPWAVLPAADDSKASEERPRWLRRGALLLLSRPRPSPGCGGLRGLGLLQSNSHLRTERPRSWSAGSRCDYPNGGEAIILNERRKELQGLKRTPELNATRTREPGNAQNKAPSGSLRLKDTRSAFLHLPFLLPLSLARRENGPRDSKLWQRFRRVTWGRGKAGGGVVVRGGRESNPIP